MPDELESASSEKKRPFPIAFLVILAGFGALVAGIAVIFWPAALIVAGVFLMGAGYDLSTDDLPESQ